MGVAALALVAVAVMALVHAKRQGDANKRITLLARRSGKTWQDALESSLAESKSRLARLDLERGQIAFEKGQIGVGMLWTVESMRMAAEAGDAAGRHVALANLAAWRRSHLDFKEVFPHGDSVSAVAFSPDGKTIVSGSFDKTARLWDVASGKPIGRPMLHQDWVRSAVFSPDGRLLATGSNDKTARLWVAATGQEVGRTLEHPSCVFSVAFSPDGKTLATACQDGAARLWGTTSGRLVGQPMVHPAEVESVAFSPDGKTVLTGSWGDKTARMWDAATGRPFGQPMHHSGPLRSVAFSPDGKTILTGGHDKTCAALGCRHRPPRRQANGASRYSLRGGVQPRRQDHPYRLRRQDREALGHCYRRASGPASRASDGGLGRGVQPRRPICPYRLRRRHGATVGWHVRGAGRSGPRCREACGRPYIIFSSARTGRPFSAWARTVKSADGTSRRVSFSAIQWSWAAASGARPSAPTARPF